MIILGTIFGLVSGSLALLSKPLGITCVERDESGVFIQRRRRLNIGGGGGGGAVEKTCPQNGPGNNLCDCRTGLLCQRGFSVSSESVYSPHTGTFSHSPHCLSHSKPRLRAFRDIFHLSHCITTLYVYYITSLCVYICASNRGPKRDKPIRQVQ